jgi:hypothetical protein
VVNVALVELIDLGAGVRKQVDGHPLIFSLYFAQNAKMFGEIRGSDFTYKKNMPVGKIKAV